MPAFELVTRIREKSPKEVFHFLKEMERFLAPVIGLRIEPLGIKSFPTFHNQWQIDLGGAPLSWTQENKCHHGSRTLKFRQVQGDLANLSGCWKVEKTDQGSRLRLRLEVDYGLSHFEKLIGAKLAAKTRKLAGWLVWTIKNQLRRAGSSDWLPAKAEA